jgi:hypothetical protein
MKRISIERYKIPTSGYAGCIEGETDDGTQWIMFLDETGKPEIFWPDRTPDGGVVGTAIGLTHEHYQRAAKLRMTKMEQILQDPDPAAVVERLRGALAGAEKIQAGDHKVPDKIWDIRNERVFGRKVTPDKPEL